MKKYLKLLRVKHYMKNLLIFLPFIFSGQFFQSHYLASAMIGFFAFSLLSSAIYIFNDIRDAESDRMHPTKKNRPIASGEVSKRAAYITGACLLIGAAVLHCFTLALQWYAWLFLVVYFVLNLAYSIKLKNVPIVDVAVLVSGFVLRVFYGSALGGIEISRWLYLTVIAMSFYLGLGKRRNELMRQGGDASRGVLKFYTQNFLDKNMFMCLALTVAFYSLWAIDPVTI
ncbi:MAG: prenyltransferase, partial [Clostridiales bacterium 43-6]